MKSTMRILSRFTMAVALATAMLGVAACEDDDGAVENAGEEIQDAADDAGDAIDDAMD